MKSTVITALVAVILSTSQLYHVTAGGKPVNGNGAPYVQTPVKAPNVVTDVKQPAKCQCGPGAIYQSKGKK